METKLKLSDLCRLNTISEVNKALSHNWNSVVQKHNVVEELYM